MNAAVAPRTATLILLCGSIVVSLSLGIRHTFGLFLQPMTADLAWSREAFSFAIALQNLPATRRARTTSSRCWPSRPS